MAHLDAPGAKRRRQRSPDVPTGPRPGRQPTPLHGPRGGRSRSRERWDRREDRRRSRSPSIPRGPRGARHRSPPRGPRPARSRSRERGYERDERNGRHGAPRPRDDGRAPTKDRKQTKDSKKDDPEAMDAEVTIDPEQQPWEYMAAQKAALAPVLGFKDFRSTKNTKVPGNDKLYAISRYKKTEYRQYMNRTGGFNRPLSPTRE